MHARTEGIVTHVASLRDAPSSRPRYHPQSEGIVTHVSNLWDTFFEGGRDHRLAQPSITHLPYFDGALLQAC